MASSSSSRAPKASSNAKQITTGIRTASGSIPDFEALFESMTDEQLKQFEELIPAQYRTQKYTDGPVPLRRTRSNLKDRFQKRLESKKDDFEMTESVDNNAEQTAHVFGPYRKRLREKLKARLERRVAALRRVQIPIHPSAREIPPSSAATKQASTAVFVPSIQAPQFLLSPNSSLSGVAFLSAFGVQAPSQPMANRKPADLAQFNALPMQTRPGLIGGTASSVVVAAPLPKPDSQLNAATSLNTFLGNIRSDNFLATSSSMSSSMSTTIADPNGMKLEEDSGVRLSRRKSTDLLKMMLSAADSNLGASMSGNMTNADLEILNQYRHLDTSVAGLLNMM